MRIQLKLCFFVAYLLATAVTTSQAQDLPRQNAQNILAHTTSPATFRSLETRPDLSQSRPFSVDGAILHPVQSATVSAEVPGILEKFHAEEGDRVSAGQVVAEIATRRFLVNANRARVRVRSLEAAVKTARKNCELKRKILSQGAATEQELLNADAALEAREAELGEARQLLKLAQLDLDGCKIKAPFDGFIDQRFKSPFEAVEKSDKLFEIVDASSIFALANVPTNIPDFFEKGRAVLFINASGKEFIGTVQKLGMKIDPRSKTRKVFVLIPNNEGFLQIGMSGQLRLAE